MIRATVLDTPIGPLALLERDGALVASGFTADPRELHARLHPSLRRGGRSGQVGWGDTDNLVTAPDLGDISKAHEAYFDGDLTALDALPVHTPASWRREKLWAALREVRPGQTITYGELADRAGITRGARAAGQACAQNLVAPTIPCHRIVAAGGSATRRLNGYAYGLDRKEWLLRHESAI
jgi:methylated-DNA-[protein]-cysteine S-methyltransferase